jgi:hypothetical protein
MKRLSSALIMLALTAGCASGGGSKATAVPVTPQSAKSRVNMSFTPAANAKKVIVVIDGQSSPALTLANQPQTATLPGNLAISVDCVNQASGSASGGSTSNSSGETCTLLTLLPPGQHDVSVQQLDFLNGLITDLDQFITLADGNNFFGNFFGASPLPLISPTPGPVPS